MYFLIRNNILMLNSGKLYKEKYHIINAKLNDGIKIKNPGNSYIEGQSFENTDEVKHSPIKYIVESSKTKEILEEYESTDGSFKIENLQDNENINLIVLDLSKKYNGKYIENIPVQLDYSKAMKIIRVYQTTNTAHIKVKFNGDPSAVAVLVENASIEKIDIENYLITGINGSYTVTLYDYVDNVWYIKESIYN